jgi:transcriptional regulator
MSKKKAKKKQVEPQRETNDLHAGIRAALRYHLKSGADPLEAVELVAANLDEEGRHEMIELGLLAMIEALSARGEL